MDVKTKRTGLLAAGLVALGAAAIVGISTASTPEVGTFTAEGVYAVTDAYPTDTGCAAAGNHAKYLDDGQGGTDKAIRDGAQVGIYDSDHHLLAEGQLEPGTWRGAYTGNPQETCRWRFTIPNVPAGKGVYRIEVGASLFGGEVSESQLKSTATFLDDQVRA